MSPHWSDIAGNEEPHLNSSSLELTLPRGMSPVDFSVRLSGISAVHLNAFQTHCILITLDFQASKSFLLRRGMIIKTLHCEPKWCIGLPALWDWLCQTAHCTSKNKNKKKQPKQVEIDHPWLVIIPPSTSGKMSTFSY